MKIEITKNVDSKGKPFLVFTKILKNGYNTVVGTCRLNESDFETFKKNHLGDVKNHQIVWV